MKSCTIITIDGPSGVGKSTAARTVAGELGYSYLDTGAMYRAVALEVVRKRVNIDDGEALGELLDNTGITVTGADGGAMRISINGEDVTDLIRTREIGLASSDVATKPAVRKKLVEIQRLAGEQGDIVAEGRDMGTYVFPDADYKFYLDADLEKRASRRWKELTALGNKADISEIKKEIRGRDRQDMERAESPLHPAPNAVIIDTTNLDAQEVVAVILREVQCEQTPGSE